MGGPMSANLIAAGRRLVVFDAAGTAQRAPHGTELAHSSAEVGERSDTVLFSLPDGKAQAMKLLNNFLAATGIAASSEAIAFGERSGLDMKTMLDVLNVSTGRNMATLDKFPNRVLTGTYDAGFTSRLLLKDLLLYETAARESGCAIPIGPHVADVWRRFEDSAPGSDITRMFLFIRSLGLENGEE